MPFVGAAVGGNHNGTSRRAAGVGILQHRAYGELADCFGREVLQKAANVVIGVVAAVNGEVVVEAGTPTGGDCSDARFRGIGRLDRFGAGREVGDVGKAPSGEGGRFKVLGADDG